MQFGHEFRKKHFPNIDPAFVPVNHGLFGLPPQCVVDEYTKHAQFDLGNPDTYHQVHQFEQYTAGLKAVAGFFNCPYTNLALVTNATTGVNTVLRLIPFQKGDKIALASTTYGACANTVKFLAENYGVVPIIVPLKFPMSHSDVVAAFALTFAEHNIKLALYDAVVSMPGVRLPFVELTKLCRQHKVLSLVDGAHLAGLVPLDFEGTDFEPDFFTTNLHKWMLVPRGCAALYVAPQRHRAIQTLPISHSYVLPSAELSGAAEANLLVSKFAFTGSAVLAAIACIPEALNFRQNVCGGEQAIRDYCEGLARQIPAVVARVWPGAEPIENAEGTLATAMVSFYVPTAHLSRDFDAGDPAQFRRLLGHVTIDLVTNRHTFVPFNVHDDRLVIRFSAQVYTELLDFEYAAQAAKAALESYFEPVPLLKL